MPPTSPLIPLAQTTPPASPPATAIEIRRALPPILFLLGQLIVLGIGASRMELTARSGDLPQRLALPEMIAFQLAIAAMACPGVLNLTTLVGSAIFLHLSTLLTGTSVVAECWTIAIVLLWMIAFRQLTGLLRSDNSRSILRAVFSTAVIGLPLTEYLMADFSDVHVHWIDPISVAIRQSSNNTLAGSSVADIALCTAPIIFSALRRHARYRS